MATCLYDSTIDGDSRDSGYVLGVSVGTRALT